LSKINVRQIEARAEAHKGKVLAFDASGNSDPQLINRDHLNQDLQSKILFTEDLEDWALDQGAQPIPVMVGNFVADQFSGALNTAIYKDETLDTRYDPAKPLKLEYTYAMSGTETTQVNVSLGYGFVQKGTAQAPSSGYTELTDNFNADGDTNIRSRALTIPAQPGIATARPILSLRFQRLGAVDTNNDNFNLISVIIYQE
jgi:hypothetical protein